MWTMFKVFIEICYNVASVLCFGFFGHKVYGILAPQLGIEHVALIGW